MKKTNKFWLALLLLTSLATQPVGALADTVTANNSEANASPVELPSSELIAPPSGTGTTTAPDTVTTPADTTPAAEAKTDAETEKKTETAGEVPPAESESKPEAPATPPAFEQYHGFITKYNWSLWQSAYDGDTVPLVGKTNAYMGKELVVLDEKTTTYGTYLLLADDSQATPVEIGWLNVYGFSKEGIAIDQVQGTQIEEALYVTRENWSLWNMPYQANTLKLGVSTDIYKQEVKATRRAVTASGTYVLISHKDVLVGWINENGTMPAGEPYERNDVYLTKADWSIWSHPYVRGTTNQLVKYSTAYTGEKVNISRRAKTNNGTYVLFSFKDQEIGWINEGAIADTMDAFLTSQGVVIPNTYGKITRNNWSIWAKPYKPETAERSKSNDFVDKRVLFNARAKTKYGTYLKTWIHRDNGWNFVGWINESGTTYHDKVFYDRPVSKDMERVSKSNWSIWNSPYVYGSREIGKTTTYMNKNVQIIRESKTNYATYYQIKYMGQVIGWVNQDALASLSTYEIPIAWVNQINTAGYAGSGCAASQIYATLQSKNYAMDKDLTWFYNNLPLHDSNPDLGQIGHALRPNEFKAVISPVGATNFARSLGGNAENITGKSMSYVRNEVKKGNPVMIWGKAGLRYPNTPGTTHVLTIIGYQPGYYWIQEPASGNINAGGRSWITESFLDSYLQMKGRKQVVMR